MTFQNNLNQATQCIKELEKAILTSFLDIGKALSMIQKTKAYKAKYNSFEQYLEKEGFSFTRQHAYNMIRIYNKVKSMLRNPEQKLKIEQLGIAKLLLILNQDPKEQNRLIIKAQKTSVRQLNKDLKTKKNAGNPGKKALDTGQADKIANTVREFRQELAKINKPTPELVQELHQLKDQIEKILS
ncbi:DUF3102 domain-containing protein [Candidatus Woesearchaeota archaeon]|nr:DUF3102 domain-containing protein [Candidatus Woesearchaeota archaeon]